MSQREVVIQGAREHNLKGVDLRLPRGALITMTGVSGSGKSSLAFDTIYQEGQRRFVESLSSYARQFLGQTEKPRVEHIEGLSPTISIDQKTVNRSPRSTVGTVTEIHDHLRLLFSRLGVPRCPGCGRTVVAQSAGRIVDRILEEHAGRHLVLLAPIVKDRKGEYRKELEALRMKGYARARIDGTVRRLDEPITLARYERHTIEAVLDRIEAAPARRARFAEAVENGLKLGDGVVSVLDGDVVTTFSSRLACPDCGVSLPELEPRAFSFNSPHGACPDCDGLGVAESVDPGLVVPRPDRTIADGAIAPMTGPSFSLRHHLSREVVTQVCRHFGIRTDVPWKDLPAKARRVVLEGSPEKVTIERTIEGRRMRARTTERRRWQGVVPVIEDVHRRLRGQATAAYMSPAPCAACGGTRLRPSALSVLFRDRTIADLGALTVSALAAFLRDCRLEGRERAIGEPIFRELESRVKFLEDVGLGYLTMSRGTASLSGGESQRIRLATQVGSSLRGILYVLDEPSIGLHQRDNRRLIETLARLRDAGNTVVVVEHDLETMHASDWLVDVGPGAGRDGGEIVATGGVEDLVREPRSVTGAFLGGRERIRPPPARRAPSGRTLGVRGAREHNLANLDVDLPLGTFIAVTGVSGSGKSTLVNDILRRALANRLHGAQERVGAHDAILGIEHLDKVIDIDQSPIGRTPRSNPATYTKVFDEIRELFAGLPESKARGYARGRFSFNVKGGRCEACGGAGVKLVEMQFLADVQVPCDVCDGHRFNPETLEVCYRFKSITDVLSMTISEALAFFANHAKIRRGLETLDRIGLGYVQLGQPSTTLSGGEAQRVKLARELKRPPTGRTLYLLDEPTTGLHFLDIRRLVAALQALVDAGNTVVVIEHNLDVVRCADWVLDLGPEGGQGGGRIVYNGPYEGILGLEDSATGRMLREAEGARAPSLPRRPIEDRSTTGDVVLRGARLNNLKNVEARFPAGRLTVVTGPSGSGKTSLVFDTLFAEGQRRFVECLSTYARQFLGRLDRPPLDGLEGLAPSIAIDQKNASRNPRSTVATTTEIQDHLRLLFARVGVPHCPDCGREAAAFPPDAVVKDILRRFADGKGRILAPLWLKGFVKPLRLTASDDLAAVADELRSEGFQRLLVDGEEVRLDAPGSEGALRARKAREIFLVVDRVQVSAKARTRLLDSVAQAYAAAHGILAFEPVDGARVWYGEHPSCAGCGFFLDEALAPRMFSFNSHAGACEACHGLGVRLSCDPEKLVANPDRPLFDGALVDKPGDFLCRADGYFRHVIEKLGEHLDFDVGRPWSDLPADVRRVVMRGLDRRVDLTFESRSRNKRGTWEIAVAWKGLCHYVEDWYRTSDNEEWVAILAGVMRSDRCRACDGERLKPAFRAVRFAGETLAGIGRMTVFGAAAFVAGVKLEKSAATVAEQPLREVRNRLGFLDRVGLGYLELARAASTLSGGEAQRIRLATQIGNRLTGVIYVLDEPTIGLHQRDNERLLGTLRDLRDLGNTIVVVEHDRETIETADWVLDLGPGAGAKGGEIVFQGPPDRLAREGASLTGRYLRGEITIPARPGRRSGNGRALVLEGASANNLRRLEVAIPAGCLVSVTGVSGSGKSTLVMDTLAPAMALATSGRRVRVPGLARLRGAEAFDQCITVDQAPIGTSPKSNPASYTKVLDGIREIFATAPLAVQRGYGPGRFSYNVGPGRCGACDGRGSLKIEMHFLPDVWITCEECRGRRYNQETLDVEYLGRTIADVLAMEVSEAASFFANHGRIASPLRLLEDVGLGYLELGRPATTLSGGEAQRIKLARELSRRSHGRTLYLLDEPTTGLHFDDVKKLVHVLDRLVEAGNTVVVIEHNLDVIAASDHVIDLGPEGGDGGGRIVAQGTPEEVARARGSHTGRFLARALAPEGGAIRRQPRAAGAGSGAPGGAA
jgi:excinuclease ABC subunit A